MKIFLNAKVIPMVGSMIECGAVAVEGNRIYSVLPMSELDLSNPLYAAAEHIDCGGKTILPGLVNAHIHITLWRSYGDITLSKDTATEAMMACRNALNCIRKGVTSVRDMGHKDLVHMEIKKASRSGVILAPRFRCADTIIEMSHGHANHFCCCVNSGDELVAEIRRQVNCGTDFIKLVTSHDDLWHLDGEELTFPWFSQELLSLAVRTSHELNTSVSAHANGSVTIQRCLNAGVDCIEHGIGLTEELAAQMREQNTFYVPTLTGYKENGTDAWHRGPAWVQRYHKLWKRHEEGFHWAVDAGVPMAAGTDTLGDLNQEILLLHEFGLTPLQALEAATIQGAKVMGMENEVGSLEPGKLADLLVLSQDPLQDLHALYQLEKICFDGRVLDAGALDQIIPPCDIYAKNW